MLFSYVTSSLRKPVYRHLILYQRNKQFCIHKATCYCSYTKNTETDSHLNIQTKESETHLFSHNGKRIEINGFKQESIAHGEDTFSDGFKYSLHIKNRVDKTCSSPFADLKAVYSIVKTEFGGKDYLTCSYKTGKPYEKIECTITVSWPENATFSGTGPNRKLATKNASLNCLYWLYHNGKISLHRGVKPIMYDQEEIRSLLNEPVRINLQSEFKNDMEALVNRFDSEIKPIIMDASQDDYADGLLNYSQINYLPVHKRSWKPHETRNNELLSHLRKRAQSNKELPINNYKAEILNALENNQILLIKGDTGCGKSTQVPQFILDAYTEADKVHECNIIASEPRRISAISLANRLAEERGEELGDAVGYHVRLQHVLPIPEGSILFCTTGILLRRIQANPTLEGVSHIIVDEAHERTLEIDILLALLKDVLKTNPKLKLIIMSATINSELFQEYFSCAVVNVPGKMYPVKMHFLEDLKMLNKVSLSSDLERPEVPYGDIVKLVEWILYNKPRGAILCFLPGWREICELENMLRSRRLPGLLILLLHSKLPFDIQQQIFNPVPEDRTKIILATNVAESSITIEDVTYVIDTALKKDREWKGDKSMYCLDTMWISKANISQRQGRAGRVKAGESYHFISKEKYEELDMYPVPQIRRTALEETIICSKTFNDQRRVHDFFNSMLERPSTDSVSAAVKRLKNLGILNEDESLTALGRRVAHLSLEPRLSIAVVFSCIFECLESVLWIAGVYSTDNEMSVTTLNDKSDMRTRKQELHSSSDHIASSMYCKQLHEKIHSGSVTDRDYRQRKEDVTAYRKMKQIFELNATELARSKMLLNASDVELCNTSDSNELVRAILFSATNHLLTHVSYGYKNGYFSQKKHSLITENNEKALITSYSVNYNRRDWPSSFLTYLHKLQQSRTPFVSDTSLLSPLSVLLFSRGEVYQKRSTGIYGKDEVVMSIKNIHHAKFSTDKETAKLLLEFRDVIWNVVDYIIKYKGTGAMTEDLLSVTNYKDDLLPFLRHILTESSKNIDESTESEGNRKSQDQLRNV